MKILIGFVSMLVSGSCDEVKMKKIGLKKLDSVLFAIVSVILSSWAVDVNAMDLKGASENTPIYLLDSKSFVITVASDDVVNSALSSFSGYKSMTASDRLQSRYTLRTAFVEGKRGAQANIPAMNDANAGKAVCIFNYRESAIKDSDDFFTTKNEALTPELTGQQSVGFDGAIYLKGQYFYIYCQKKDTGLTLGYFNRAFSGVLKIHSVQAD